MIRSKRRASKKLRSSKVLVMRKPVRISHRRHNGKLLPIHYTSYAVLFFLLIMTGFVILFTRMKVASALNQTMSGDIQISGLVQGIPPATAAVILQPTDGKKFDHSIIDVSGTCIAGMFISIVRNSVSAGSTVCSGAGTFSLSITLQPGKNKLVARTKDALDQYGPDSAEVDVTYNKKKGQQNEQISSSTTKAPNLPLTIYTEPFQDGIMKGQFTNLTFSIRGGDPPYAVSIDWGDGSQNTLASFDKSGSQLIRHKFLKPDTYLIGIRVSDGSRTKAFIQTVLIVSGAGEISAICENSNPNCRIVQNVLIQKIDQFWWPLVAAFLMAFSFWLGERYILNKYKKVITY